MKLWRFRKTGFLTLLGGVAVSVMSTGCQTTVGGQTLPSPTYLTDDVQFFPAGPEFILSKQEQALERYRLEQEGLDEAGVDDTP